MEERLSSEGSSLRRVSRSTDLVREAEATDLDRIRELLANIPEAAQWPDEALGSASRLGLLFRVAEHEGIVCGVIAFRRMADEAEILNLAVERSMRRRGIGTRLMETAAGECKVAGVKRIFLEVRQSNRAARDFYVRMGFRETGRRKNYYERPTEDALVLFRTVD